jgi:predicted Mrr-cat superfamily restriction endonuclease
MVDASPVAVGLAVGALFRLANEFDVGDYVLTPEAGGNILAGEMYGPYAFDPSPVYEDYCHTRPVRWFARIPRSTLPEDMRRTESPWKSWRLHSVERTMEPCQYTTGRGIRLR